MMFSEKPPDGLENEHVDLPREGKPFVSQGVLIAIVGC